MKFKFLVVSLLLVVVVGCLQSNEDGSNNESVKDESEKSKSEKSEIQASKGLEESWHAIQQKKKGDLAAYIKSKDVAYRWVMDFPFGKTDGIPYIILKLLPIIAPEQWGGKDDFLDVVGLETDDRYKSYPIARGIGFTGLAREDLNGAVDVASFTCGACHIGRVRLADGSFEYMDGGINSQFSLPQFRLRVVNTIKKMVGDAKTDEDKVTNATQSILAALDKVTSLEKQYFYKDYQFYNRKFDIVYEENQIKMFKQQASLLVSKFLVRSDLDFRSFAELLDHSYPDFQEEMLNKFSGMADATGVSTSFGYIYARDILKDKSATIKNSLPPEPGLTDFMAIWEQGKRKVSWNADKTELINGGGQWNGNIPIPMFRNMAAELTLGLGADTDLRIAAFGKDLLEDLPAAVYPFEVDMGLADHGKKLFEGHCLDCHKPHNGNVYDLGTDLSREGVVSESIKESARASFSGICPTETQLTMPDGKTIKPCESFDGVSLADKKHLLMLEPGKQMGYNALPLGGVWAQAPYLHNGSIPTAYHLLVVNERPDAFVKSSLNYDKELLGFSWEIPDQQDSLTEGYIFDSKAFHSLSNKGHDTDVTVNGRLHKLNWSDDKKGAVAIVEYLKTL